MEWKNSNDFISINKKKAYFRIFIYCENDTEDDGSHVNKNRINVVIFGMMLEKMMKNIDNDVKNIDDSKVKVAKVIVSHVTLIIILLIESIIAVVLTINFSKCGCS